MCQQEFIHPGIFRKVGSITLFQVVFQVLKMPETKQRWTPALLERPVPAINGFACQYMNDDP